MPSVPSVSSQKRRREDADNTGTSGIGQKISLGSGACYASEIGEVLEKVHHSEALENGISETGVMPVDGGVVVSDKVLLEEGIRKPRHRGKKAGNGGNSDSLVSESD